MSRESVPSMLNHLIHDFAVACSCDACSYFPNLPLECHDDDDIVIPRIVSLELSPTATQNYEWN